MEVINTNTAVNGTQTATTRSATAEVEVTKKTITGSGESFAPDLKIYPNPFMDEVQITGAVSGLGQAMPLRVINSEGSVAHTQIITCPDEIARLEHLPVGVYFFWLEKDRKAKTIKVVKQ